MTSKQGQTAKGNVEKQRDDLKPMTVADLIAVLLKCNPRAFVVQATDEEGNAYSPVTECGLSIQKDEVCFYPILVTY